ncbi:DegV family protein [Caproiciproducens galactitolivorans]|uniref:DegV domain-containing protein n=1 Tax=Caproiciproducens galactitolivorans TaxID=642589 RepID=A0A4Z0YE59_9FIRM|nr:DegV family protein [Caproiciproducens galactitolivorans]QEY35466.1 DegV family protein [Caproiciproducens galactitolivorans]TGJ77180.1 DegV domain-containing protein [Caproiciproducens galactitolivorans]
MSEYAIVTDSSCDLPAELAEELELTVLPLSFNLMGREYHNYLDERELPFKEFYRSIREGMLCTTSAVNMEAFKSAMEPILQSGRDVLCIAFSSGLSNTYNAAKLACEELTPKYPERKAYAVDSLCASMGEGLLLSLAVEEKRKGKSIDELRIWLEETKLRVCHWFTVENLHHLKRGGRISGPTALIGTMLNIKPVLHVDDEGHLINMGKARGRRASLLALVDHMEQTAVNPASQTVFISHGDAKEDAEFVAEEIKARLGVKKFVISYVGPVIGAHSGPGTIALFFLGSKR